MDLQLHRAGIQLDAKRFLTLRDARGTRVLCVAGELWITQDRDTADYVLGPGDSLEIGVDGAVVVHGLHASRLLLLEPAARPRAFRPRTRRLDGRSPLAVQFHGA